MAYVYFIEHKTARKGYIGWTGNLKKRWADHRGKVRAGRASHFYNALRKHGLDAFDWHVVEWYDTAVEAMEAEKFWIARLREFEIELYNESDGGEGTVGRSISDETKAKLSASLRGRPHGPFSEDTRTKMSMAARRKIFSDEHRQNLAAAGRGKVRGPLSDETKRKISEAKRGKKLGTFTEEHRQRISEGLRKYHTSE